MEKLLGKICDKLDKISHQLKKTKHTTHNKASHLSSSEQVIDNGSAVKKVEGKENPENYSNNAADIEIESIMKASASYSEVSSDHSSAVTKPIKTKMK